MVAGNISCRMSSSDYPGVYLQVKKMAYTEWVRKTVFYYPLSFSGTLLLFISVFLLGKSYTGGNPYGLMLAVLALVVLMVFAAGGRLQAGRMKKIPMQWDSAAVLRSGTHTTLHRVYFNRTRPFFFYRMHFCARGSMDVGRNAVIYMYTEVSSCGEESVPLPLYFALSGEWNARGSFKIKDIFGLTRARVGQELPRKLHIQPGEFSGKKTWYVDAVGGFEEKTTRKYSDEERYYMREYIPGDRLRDINWKASSRLPQLITRIAPHTQEKTRRINMEFRNFKQKGPESVESVVHLDQLKRWVLFFLRKVKKEKPEYIFQVKTGRESVELNTADDIERFAQRISGLFFQTGPGGSLFGRDVEEVYIFSTPYDENLSLVLASYQNVKLRLFLTTVSEGGQETFRLYGGLKSFFIPGSWVFRRDRNLKKPRVHSTGKLSDFSSTTTLSGGFPTQEHPVKIKVL
ncbi:MAG: DUF58 domain-containing protein [Spirochaetota bacterium]